MEKVEMHKTEKRSFFHKISTLMNYINKINLVISMIAVLIASSLLTYSSASRYLFKKPTDWQDEISIFLLVGAVFLSNAYVQAQRGHVGIEFLEGVLSPKINRIRHFFIDVVSMLFCSYFSWKSWVLFLEAIIEHQTTRSSLGSPLWIPYSLMAVGMSLLALQIFLQIIQKLCQNQKGEH